MSDGTWVAYVVDHDTSINLQGRNGEENSEQGAGFEYGIMCEPGLGAQKVGGTDGPRAGFGGTADNDVTTNPSYYQGFGDSKTLCLSRGGLTDYMPPLFKHLISQGLGWEDALVLELRPIY
jgi:hypothetical protein